jgi:hypothetical protein
MNGLSPETIPDLSGVTKEGVERLIALAKQLRKP